MPSRQKKCDESKHNNGGKNEGKMSNRVERIRL